MGKTKREIENVPTYDAGSPIKEQLEVKGTNARIELSAKEKVINKVPTKFNITCMCRSHDGLKVVA